MANAETQVVHRAAEEAVPKLVASVPIVEGIGAIAAIVLAVVGLAGILANLMAAIATIVLGAAILTEGGAIGSFYRQLIARGKAQVKALAPSSALTAEFLGGLAGIVLGILALFGTAPETLLAVAVLVFGTTLLLGSAALSRLSWLGGMPVEPSAQEVAAEAAAAASSGQMLAGVGAIVLGILAVIGLVPLTLILAGLLSLGAATLLGGFVMGRRAMAFGHR